MFGHEEKGVYWITGHGVVRDHKGFNQQTLGLGLQLRFMVIIAIHSNI